jgi:ribosomal protein S9
MAKKLKVYADADHRHKRKNLRRSRSKRNRYGRYSVLRYGRRKTSTARVYLRPGSGTITVNKREFNSYFPNEALQMIIRQPLTLTDTIGKFDIYVNVDGGGSAGQAWRGSSRHHACIDGV